MPMLDVSDVVVDPDLADLFDVIQRPQTVDGSTGRASTGRVVTTGVVGVVTMENPADLMRGEESDATPRLIFVASTFRFRSVSKEGTQQYKGDLIVWPQPGQQGSTEYLVIKVYPYSRYGTGITEVVAQSLNATDEVI